MTRRQLIAMLKIGDAQKTTGWSAEDDRPTLESKLAKLVYVPHSHRPAKGTRNRLTSRTVEYLCRDCHAYYVETE